MIGEEQFKKSASELVRIVKGSKTKPGKNIHIPGYDSELKIKQKVQSGEINIGEDIIQQLKDMKMIDP